MDKVGLFLNNMYSNKIFDNVIDEDLTAMYPSLIRSGNLDISTMIGRIYSDDNPLLGELLFELMCLANKGLTANKLLNLPTASHVILNIDKYIQPIS
jgi:DNA polymerase elongation subunit (family B)